MFEKPKIDEIKKYCKDRKNGVDSEAWFDFYESKGWMIGKNKMVNWQAAVRTWERKGNAPTQKRRDETNETLEKMKKWEKEREEFEKV
jgi:hypothetical protein